MVQKIDNLQTPSLEDAEKLSSDEIKKMLDEQGVSDLPSEETDEQAEQTVDESAPSKAVEEKAEKEVKKESAEEPWYSTYSGEFKEFVKKKGFKSLDDATKAYLEMEKKSTKDAQLRSHYRETLDPYVEFDADGNVQTIKHIPEQHQPPQQSQVKQSDDDILASWENRYVELEASHGAGRANILLQMEMANRLVDARLKGSLDSVEDMQAERSVERQKANLRSKADYSELEPDIDRYLSRMDTKSKLNPHAVLTLYKIVRGEKADDLWEKRKADTNAETAETEKMKEEAQVSHSTKTPEEPNFDVENASSEELKKHLGLRRMQRY